MFGWRKRIGYIGPTVMEVVPYEFYRFAPDGVGLVGVTCNIDDWTEEHFNQALAQVTTAASYLGSRGVDYILHGGGPLVVARGKGYEETIVKEIEAAGKVPATTGVRAAMEALRVVSHAACASAQVRNSATTSLKNCSSSDREAVWRCSEIFPVANSRYVN